MCVDIVNTLEKAKEEEKKSKQMIEKVDVLLDDAIMVNVCSDRSFSRSSSECAFEFAFFSFTRSRMFDDNFTGKKRQNHFSIDHHRYKYNYQLDYDNRISS